jgi:hypothetical protein
MMPELNFTSITFRRGLMAARIRSLRPLTAIVSVQGTVAGEGPEHGGFLR